MTKLSKHDIAELESAYLTRIVQDTSAVCDVDVRYPQDAIWARIWIQVKPYGIVRLSGWASVEQVQAFSKLAHASLGSNGSHFFLKSS